MSSITINNAICTINFLDNMYLFHLKTFQYTSPDLIKPSNTVYKNCKTRFIYDLMLASDEFELEELTNKLENLLIETKAFWLRTHFSFIYHFIFKSALVSLLKRNDLQMKEVKVWDYVIKWGIAQTSLPTNFDNWTNENFIILKAILQKSLPNIRYFHLSSIEVVDKIEPFKKILDKQLWEDINQYLIAERPIKSTILPPRSVLVIELPPHGFVPQTFWNMCHGPVCTVVLVKVKGTDEIIGGYNPLTWDKNAYGRWIETKDSFIFSLKNGNIQNSILSRVKNSKCAIYI
ncbi:hypothetical protein Glove_383g23 [Diversispora epigaea]|uniref:TLDc domain-containing protein n=1 Tax=Diversispora epigaea TaxID=1348612 RepID=A0A397H441_9GLOM|nr:hypothetical protein Glove_383g23 [Diversispora epigaea]